MEVGDRNDPRPRAPSSPSSPPSLALTPSGFSPCNHQVIANAVTNSLMTLQFEVKKPIIFGVLTTLSLAQAEERAHSALAASWADSALCMTRFSP